MDLSAIIIVIALTALFVGFIAWLAIYSRSAPGQESSAATDSEVGLKGE